MKLHDAPLSDYAAPARLDPRARLLTALLLSAGTVLCADAAGSLLFLVLAVVLTLLARAAPGQTARGLRSVNFFMLFVWLTLPLTVPGPPLFPGFDALSRPGAALALTLTLKANACFLFLVSLCGGLGLNGMGAALQGLRAPEKMLTLFILTGRHIGDLRDEFRSALRALSLRAPGLRGMKALRVYACLVGSALVRSADRAEMVRLALSCKRGRLLYETRSRLRWTWKETLMCCAGLALCVAGTLL